MPMRTECKHFESRTYKSGDTVRKCNLDMAPDAPWRCPEECEKYERRMIDIAWAHGSLVPPATPVEPASLDDGTAADVLQLRADERPALAGLHVLELDDAPRVTFDVDVHAILELVGANGLGHGRGV